ncbi:unnamed protein product [Prorocentrum cordatum]|uniref:Uncharacterized protein n=1 Tax=Prorocentrum cordatum TaxID=2364126 RepID=A0ABN9QG49_9DINO|nr:unnamed protein product [Polarella glacialis]
MAARHSGTPGTYLEPLASGHHSHLLAVHARHFLAVHAGRPLALLKDRDLASEDTRWEPLVEDGRRRSFSYVLRRHRTGLSEEELSRWFQALHPNNAGVGTGSWTDAAYQGRRLLRKTAWYVAPPCTCAYDYADTHQDVVTSPAFRGTIEEITVRVAEVCGLADPPNSVNQFSLPRPGLQRDTCIISLSLTEPGEVGCGVGSRWFEVKLKRAFCLGAADRRTRAVELRWGLCAARAPPLWLENGALVGGC